MPERWPHTIPDPDGGEVTVDLGPEPGEVYLRTGPGGVFLNAGLLEQLAQALVAASHEAEGLVTSDG
jgi:hypothetical protein